MNKDTLHMIERVTRFGVTLDDVMALRRISMTLHRWHELECGDGNGYIERDEETGKPFYVNCNSRFLSANDPRCKYPVADKKKGAVKRLGKIMARYPALAAYIQTDPRGAALYVYKTNSELLKSWSCDIKFCYSSVGCAIYK